MKDPLIFHIIVKTNNMEQNIESNIEEWIIYYTSWASGKTIDNLITELNKNFGKSPFNDKVIDEIFHSLITGGYFTAVQIYPIYTMFITDHLMKTNFVMAYLRNSYM